MIHVQGGSERSELPPCNIYMYMKLLQSVAESSPARSYNCSLLPIRPVSSWDCHTVTHTYMYHSGTWQFADKNGKYSVVSIQWSKGVLKTCSNQQVIAQRMEPNSYIHAWKLWVVAPLTTSRNSNAHVPAQTNLSQISKRQSHAPRCQEPGLVG